jgi:hypothetical protein
MSRSCRVVGWSFGMSRSRRVIGRSFGMSRSCRVVGWSFRMSWSRRIYLTACHSISSFFFLTHCCPVFTSSSVVPSHDSHLYHRISARRISRNTPRYVVTTCYNKSEYPFSCVYHWLCLQQETIEALQNCAVKLCNGDRCFAADIPHSKITFTEILDCQSITVSDRDCQGKM